MTRKHSSGKTGRFRAQTGSGKSATPTRLSTTIRPSSQSDAPSHGKPTILVVEDERIVARDLQQRLTSQGFSVPEIASSGEEALRKAAAVRPQLILMDIHLSGRMDGIQAARLIKEQLKIPVLFLTAFGDRETETNARLLDPVSYLCKPVDDHELYTALNTFFSRSRDSRR
jgi:CheY-like chemotaxis protein